MIHLCRSSRALNDCRRLRALVFETLLAAVVLAISPVGGSAAVSPDVVVTADDSGGNGTANGRQDEFRLVRNGAVIEIYVEGILSRSLPLDTLQTLTVNGSADDDTLTVDFSGGNPTPSGGLFYNGGDNGFDTLRLAGGSLGKIAYTYFNPTDGAINIDGGTLTYTGLEPILDLVPSPSLIGNGTNANNTITYTQNSVALHGLVAVDNFETIEFANKTSLVINGLLGNDDIVLDNPNVPTGLTSITVNGGLGNDVITVAGDNQVAITINGDEGDDLFKIIPSVTSAITCNGDADVIGDRLLVLVDADGIVTKDTGSVVKVSGFADVNYTGMEKVDRVPPRKKKTLLKAGSPL
ncbi:MAG: hypothetical protein HY268_15815 [Deltaproteobacteria bacterium]|nr:hypothetical protein [Deltaproteobacteria bacterium]